MAFYSPPGTGQGRSVGELKLAPRDEQLLESESKQMWRLEPFFLYKNKKEIKKDKIKKRAAGVRIKADVTAWTS